MQKYDTQKLTIKSLCLILDAEKVHIHSVNVALTAG